MGRYAAAAFATAKLTIAAFTKFECLFFFLFQGVNFLREARMELLVDTQAQTGSTLPAQRCAIYTRKSSHHGLEQDFNSLDTQHSICLAYIQSQQHKGWQALDTVYEDAGQSGSTLDRPAMKNLLADIERGRIDVVVIYKLDRLSRSLLDFVRLIDVFQRYGVSFACITQNFDTSDTLGRLVMNVLLTFAQFEREMTGDRIRDKRRMMAQKGLWTGGWPPLGYDLVDHKLVVNEDEAVIVRRIYELFRRLKNLTRVSRICKSLGYRSKTYTPKTGNTHVGKLLSAASVRKILMNPAYTGQVRSGGMLFPGVHERIIDHSLWENVAMIRAEQAASRTLDTDPELLSGLIYDCFGRSMTANRLYRYGKMHVNYRSNQSHWGATNNVKRMSVKAADTDKLVVSALCSFFAARDQFRLMMIDLGCVPSGLKRSCSDALRVARRLEAAEPCQVRSVLLGLVERVEISSERLRIYLRSLEAEHLLEWDFVGAFRRRLEGTSSSPLHTLDIAAAGLCSARFAPNLPIPPRSTTARRRNHRLKEALSQSREAWKDVEQKRSLSVAELARRARVTPRKFQRMLRLKYLAPDIVLSIMDGTQPEDLTKRRLMDVILPLDWALQRRILGFPEA